MVARYEIGNMIVEKCLVLLEGNGQVQIGSKELINVCRSGFYVQGAVAVYKRVQESLVQSYPNFEIKTF